MTGIVGAFVLTAGLVADMTGGRLVAGSPDRVFDAVSIDSRTIGAGALFVALRGERFDGHAFTAAATAAGAAGLLVATPPDEAGTAAVIVVPDTLAALQALGRAVRGRSAARLVAITGSTGKTTTKEIASDLLAARYRVFRNPGNLNNHIGLPLSLVELRHGQEVAVVELGMNHAGEIRVLVGLARPDVRVWTNVGDAHYGFFGSREGIARAKAEILEAPGPSDVVIANADDPLVMRFVANWSGRRVLFGESASADVRAVRVTDRGLEGSTADVETPARPLHLDVPLPGRGQLHNVLAAVTVALEFGVTLDEIQVRLPEVRPVARRGGLVTLAGGARLVDDSYNASPAAVEMMLAALARTPTSGRRIAALGEMLELGDAADELHELCGRAAAAAGIDELVVVGGPACDRLVAGARAGGLGAARLHRFEDSDAAAEAVAELVRPGDLVLVKGSRGSRMDRVADRLREAR